MLVESIIRDDRNVVDLLRANYTFVNERLARHYGMPNIYGSLFRRVPVTDEARKGLLGHGSILALTSHAERTSPVLRGKWILENCWARHRRRLLLTCRLADKTGRRGRSEQLGRHRKDPYARAVTGTPRVRTREFRCGRGWRAREEAPRLMRRVSWRTGP
jgi:hypothetical protein